MVLSEGNGLLANSEERTAWVVEEICAFYHQSSSEKKKRPAKMYVCILLIWSYTHTNTHRLTASTGKVIKIMWMQADL